MSKSINLILLCLVFQCTLLAQEVSDVTPNPIPEAQIATSKQSVTIEGKKIDLNATAGTFKLRDENNQAIALLGFTSYHKDSTDSNRPIMFAYNGGPGSSSFWLHMGVLGPKRIPVNDPDATPAAPYDLVNNEYSLLDVADLVMIDPVGTGLSVPIGEAKFEDFWGVDQDIRSLSLFITQYLIEHDRMNSPKFLLGESYGTFRNAGVMDKLLSQGIALNGVIMVSAVFDIRSLSFPVGETNSYVVHFPTYAATAWYHNKVKNKSDDLEEFIEEVRAFTRDRYAPALMKGDQISANEKNSIAEMLEYFTGISSEHWVRANLKIKAFEFFQEFMREEGKTVGRLDSRFVGINQNPISQNADHDPQSYAISPAYIQGFLNYLHKDLGVSKDLVYSITAGRRQGFKWDWKHRGNEGWGTHTAINTGPDMARALSRDPNMKVLILNGYYDIATVFYGVEHSINHLGLTPEIKDNIIMEYYEAGHMMYTHMPSLQKFRTDVHKFITETCNQKSKP